MAQLIVRNLDDAVKEKLKVRAAGNGRSLEAEVREVLAEVATSVLPGTDIPPGQSLGEIMHKRFRKGGFTEAEKQRLATARAELRSRSCMRIPDFEEW